MKRVGRLLFLSIAMLSSGSVLGGYQLAGGISINEVPDFNHQLFEEALDEIKSKHITGVKMLALVDFGSPSEKERLKVIDLATNKVVVGSLVSHAMESGYRIPYNFSNEHGSNMSSLGLFLPNETYEGKNGYSLRITGVSKGRNTNARGRFIVLHGSDYVSYKYIEEHGMLGRSKGCFALPYDKYRDIIDFVKDSGALYAGK